MSREYKGHTLWDLRTAFVVPVVAGAVVSLVAEVVAVVSLPDGIQATNKSNS